MSENSIPYNRLQLLAHADYTSPRGVNACNAQWIATLAFTVAAFCLSL